MILNQHAVSLLFLWNISGDLSTSLRPVFARQVNYGTGAFHDQHLWLGSETHRWLYLGQRLGRRKNISSSGKRRENELKTTSQNKARRAPTFFPPTFLQSLQYLFFWVRKNMNNCLFHRNKVLVLDVYSWWVLLFLFGNMDSQAAAFRVFPVFQDRGSSVRCTLAGHSMAFMCFDLESRGGLSSIVVFSPGISFLNKSRYIA